VTEEEKRKIYTVCVAHSLWHDAEVQCELCLYAAYAEKKDGK
jgi:hypothetical protein